MKRYIALLRGINISGKNKISMSEGKRQDYNSNSKYSKKNSEYVIFGE